MEGGKAKAEEGKKEGGADGGGHGGGDGGKKEGSEDGMPEAAPPPPPPPPEEIIMRVFMHCEGCARKVKRSLKGFNGIFVVQFLSHLHSLSLTFLSTLFFPCNIFFCTHGNFV